MKFTDQEYLDNFVTFFKTYRFSYSYSIFDSLGNAVSVSDSLLQEFKISKYKGLKLKELESAAVKNVSLVRKIVDLILSSQERSLTLVVAYVLEDKIYVLQYIISKIINPATNNHLGLLHTVNPITVQSAVLEILRNNPAHFFIMDKTFNPKFGLNDSEREILFLLSIGKGHKEVALILSKIHNKEVSASAVTSRVNRGLYTKLEATSTPELIEKAYLSGLLEAFPLSFMNLIQNKLILP